MSWVTFLRKLDTWLSRDLGLFLILAVMVILRIPNFSEPYWYGDEGIYLTIGNALRDGELLYSEIIDHKTPLIYYMAMVPAQWQFRALLLVWMGVTTVLFAGFARRLLGHNRWALLSTAVFMLMTTLPFWEGNIPNGELFVLGWVMLAWWAMSKTSLWRQVFAEKTAAGTKHDSLWLVVAGVSLSLGVLTKVPAVFDVAAVASLGWWYLTSDWSFSKPTAWRKHFPTVLRSWGWLALGLVVPIIFSAIYFISRGSGKEYLDFGLLYNFRYASNWSLPFSNPILVKLFTLPGKLVVLSLIGVGLTGARKYLSPQLQLVGLWLGLAMVAATLSNRPYAHYFLQIVPPLALMIGMAAASLASLITHHQRRALTLTSVAHMTVSVALLVLSVAIIKLLHVGNYPTLGYYTRYARLTTGQLSLAEYRDSFNELMTDNYAAAQVIKTAGVQEIFIWGTNPVLYALSDTHPTGRFTVSFHIRDFNAYAETLQAVEEKQPAFIVVMKNETTEFEPFYTYLTRNYMPDAKYTYFTLWKRL